jgi:hypothetical protein
MKVLVVHDERPTAISIAEALHRNGHPALPICSAVEALEHAEYMSFDVAVLGLWGPSEVPLGRLLRELMPHCKVIRCVGRCIAGIMRALDAEFEYLAMDLNRRNVARNTSNPTNPRGHRPIHTFKVKELLDQLEEIRVQRAVDSPYGSQWKVSDFP